MELTGNALHYYVAGYEERADQEYWRMTFLQSKIQLMLNPNEDDHKRLEALLARMLASIQPEKCHRDDFPEIHNEVMALSRIVLKREWNVVKEPISFTGAINDGR